MTRKAPNRFLFISNTFQSQYAYVTVDWDGANVVLPAGQIWKGSPNFAIDNENGYLDQADPGPTFQQGFTLGDTVPGTVFCGQYASGINMVGSASHKCN